MEGSLWSILQKEDLICKIDSKDAYFVIPRGEGSSKFVRFEWTESLS